MLRELRKTDLSSVLTIENLTQLVPWTKVTFEHCIRTGYLSWVSEQDDVVSGFIIVSFAAGECHILNICVHPSFQSRGIGTHLMDYALTQAENKGAHFAYLEVRRSNTQAISFYHGLGFNQISERKDYYPHPPGREDALVFAKDLRVK